MMSTDERNDGLTPAGYTEPLFREPAGEKCPTSGRTAAWCTDQTHATCGTRSQIEELLHPAGCACLVCDPTWAAEVGPGEPARLFWVTADIGGAATVHTLRATEDELAGATDHAEVMMRLSDVLAERMGIDADDVFVTGAVHYGNTPA